MSANFLEHQQLAINSQSTLKAAFLSFYQANEHLFSQQEQAEALKYFDGEGENLAPIQLYERRVQCLKLCQSAKLFAEEKQRAAQAERDLQQLFQIKILGEDITNERKEALTIAFAEAKALADKKAVLAQIEHEAAQARTLHRYEKEQVELYLHLFKQFYDQDECRYYFNDTDRSLAWQSLVTSCEALDSMAQRLDRLKLLVTLLPSSLQWARQQYELYCKTLKKHGAMEEEMPKLLEQFRNLTFEEKHALIEKTKRSPKKVTVENSKEPAQSAESDKLIISYQALYCGQADMVHPQTYRSLTPTEQTQLLREAEARQIRSKELLSLWQQQSDQPRSAEAIATWQQLSLEAQEKSIILSDQPPQKQAERTPPEQLAHIAIEFIHNKTEAIYHDDNDLVKAIQASLREKKLAATFQLNHLQLIRRLLQSVPAETWHTAKTAQWVDNRLRTELYVG
ncbi:hypothetical protein KBB08_00655 [Candidatus Gracilibacteria bacterium]|nr:hypothetical protein [Candidatus Gracilibacteria bacterium]